MRVSYPISTLIAMFCSDQDVKENSRHLYKLNLRRFFIWVARQKKDARSLTRADVIQYKSDMLSRCEVTTTESYLVPVKKFFSWLSEKDWYGNIASGIKTPKRNRKYKKKALHADQVKKLLGAVDITTKKGKRDFAIMNLMIRNGLRCTEISRLNIGDVQENNGQMGLAVWGKARNDKEWVVMTSKAWDPIHEYLVTRLDTEDNNPLFASLAYNNRDGRMSPGSISRVIKMNMRKIGMDDKQLTAHSLRHTTAQMLLRAGVELYQVQKYLRHSSSKITEIYLQSINDELCAQNTPGKKMDELF